jgi:hypothetical protein
MRDLMIDIALRCAELERAIAGILDLKHQAFEESATNVTTDGLSRQVVQPEPPANCPER